MLSFQAFELDVQPFLRYAPSISLYQGAPYTSMQETKSRTITYYPL